MSTLFPKKIHQINCLSSELEQKSFDELLEFRDKCLRKSLRVTEIEWFALVREMSTRVLALRHFETQLLSGLFLNEGKIVEMKTGEGKTLASTLPLSYKALAGKGAHLITLNSYLAERDNKMLGKFSKKFKNQKFEILK